MPRYPYRGHVKAEIVARAAAGETVRAICGSAGMPTAACVQVWRRADPAFADELAQARRRGAWRRELMFDEAKAAAFLARVSGGEKINDLLGRPGMPSQRAYRYWRRTQVGFQEALWALRQGRYARQASTGHARWRGWDPGVADRITVGVAKGMALRRLLASDPALPCLAVVGRWRREQPAWDRVLRMAMRGGRLARGRGGFGGRLTPALLETIRDRVVEGASLRSLGAQDDMPCAATLYAWMARRPAFAATLEHSFDVRDAWMNERMVDMSLRNGPYALAQTKRQAAPLQRQLNRLAKRPGWKARRAAREPD